MHRNADANANATQSDLTYADHGNADWWVETEHCMKRRAKETCDEAALRHSLADGHTYEFVEAVWQVPMADGKILPFPCG